MKTIRRHFFYSNNISNVTILRYIIDTHKYEYNEYISISKTLAKDAIDEINVNNNATTEAFQVISRFPKKKKKTFDGVRFSKCVFRNVRRILRQRCLGLVYARLCNTIDITFYVQNINRNGIL